MLQISPPDPNNPTPTPPKKAQIKHDAGLALGDRGIPVARTSEKQTSEEERAWTETVFRTLSGGMKSDYLKCISLKE